MSIYPTTKHKKEAKYGGQNFQPHMKSPDNVDKMIPDESKTYVPTALDDETEAVTRMIAKMEETDRKPDIIAAGLAGSDEVGTVEKLYGELVAEKAALEAIPVDEEADYAEAVANTAKHLDAAQWVISKKAQVGTLKKAVTEEI